MAGYKLYREADGLETLTVVLDDGKVLNFDNKHPRFNDVKTQVVINNDYSQAESLLTPGKKIVAEFAKLSTELSIRGSTLYLEGEELHGVLADKIVALFEVGEDYRPFVSFLEKLHTNPNPHSVEHLYRWLEAGDFVIADDGDIIGYKGVRDDDRSVHAGPVIRNGEPFDGHVLNLAGDVVEMDRASVTFDPSQSCSQGLHVGTWDYAQGWGNKVLKVKVRPRDVVSVPTDSADQKMRVCRYTVVEELYGPIGTQYDRGYVEDEEEFADELFETFVDYDEVEPDLSNIKFSQLRDYPGMNGIPATYDPETDSFSVDPRFTKTGEAPSGETNATSKVDTRLNHLSQKRDSGGRFLPKAR